MQPGIVTVTLAEKSDLWAMFQRYARELAPKANMKVGKGDIPYPPFDSYWREDKHWLFWAVLEGERVGFALIRFAPEHNAMQVAEFYILPEYRRGGTGLFFARALLARHPGPWKMRQMAVNKGAVAFWRKVAASYGFAEMTYTDKDIERIEQILVTN